MNRRDVLTLAGKVGIVSLASQVPWAWLERAGMVADYFAQAGALPQNYLVQTGSVLCDTSLGLSGIAGHQVHDGTATWAVSEVTDSTYLRPSGTSKAFRAEVTAAAGDTCLVQDGTYVEGSITFSTSGSSGNRITLQAQNKHQAILKCIVRFR